MGVRKIVCGCHVAIGNTDLAVCGDPKTTVLFKSLWTWKQKTDELVWVLSLTLLLSPYFPRVWETHQWLNSHSTNTSGFLAQVTEKDPRNITHLTNRKHRWGKCWTAVWWLAMSQAPAANRFTPFAFSIANPPSPHRYSRNLKRHFNSMLFLLKNKQDFIVQPRPALNLPTFPTSIFCYWFIIVHDFKAGTPKIYLVHFLSTWYKLELSERWEPTVRKCFYMIWL